MRPDDTAPTPSLSLPVTVPVASEGGFDMRVAEEIQRRVATSDTHWRHVSPTDTRTRNEIERDIGSGEMMGAFVGFSMIVSIVMGALPLALVTHPATLFATFPLVLVVIAWIIHGDGRSGKSLHMASSRFRHHLHVTADAVHVPIIASDAYDTIRESADLLTTLSAPDAAIEHAVNARTEADEALITLGHLAETDDDDVWLATTAPYKRLLTLAAEVTVLAHLCRDRLALPSTNFRPIPVGVTDAADVAAYMLAENTEVAHVLDPDPSRHAIEANVLS